MLNCFIVLTMFMLFDVLVFIQEVINIYTLCSSAKVNASTVKLLYDHRDILASYRISKHVNWRYVKSAIWHSWDSKGYGFTPTYFQTAHPNIGPKNLVA